MNVIGLMSGTSCDGIDAALVRIDPDPLRLTLRAFQLFPYSVSLQKRLIELAAGVPLSVSVVCHLNAYLGELMADAAIRLARGAGVPLADIGLIGSHGQTVHHLPKPKREGRWRIGSTLQIGEPSVIAERTGVTTLADFRPRDIAAGGEGAPLTPALHHLLFSDRGRSRVVVNIGGIGNVTCLSPGAGCDRMTAFDVGPGNMAIDGLVQRLTGKKFDRDGRMAARGQVHPKLLARLMRHPFIRRPPPKSTGREAFGPSFIDRLLTWGSGLSADDLIATATAFTSSAIAENIRRFVPGRPDDVIVCGGGSRNKTLMAWLAEATAPARLCTTDDLGHPGRAIEAMAFALLAYQTWHGRATNIPSVTGARHPVVLGKIIPR